VYNFKQFICFFSFDTEALNKPMLDNADSNDFMSTFKETTSSKVNLGIQQLYTIGNYYKYSIC